MPLKRGGKFPPPVFVHGTEDWVRPAVDWHSNANADSVAKSLDFLESEVHYYLAGLGRQEPDHELVLAQGLHELKYRPERGSRHALAQEAALKIMSGLIRFEDSHAKRLIVWTGKSRPANAQRGFIHWPFQEVSLRFFLERKARGTFTDWVRNPPRSYLGEVFTAEVWTSSRTVDEWKKALSKASRNAPSSGAKMVSGVLSTKCGDPRFLDGLRVLIKTCSQDKLPSFIRAVMASEFNLSLPEETVAKALSDLTRYLESRAAFKN